MSKTFKTRLTGSRKTRRRQAAQPDLDWRDGVNERCHNLNLLAELLKACRQAMEPTVISDVGYWMSEELRALQAALDRAGKAAR